ncbi:helix-turn-helix domain-containing protein [Chitinophaga qingshengii]|uniref:Helix-turn-helix domain-containing protein n=1 Tax=Chitinophaga qingshengii TaxID=1569794 RepID=A0ABR7THI3_9BACT|nr:AraC family transcriptional regulator [Chitinophaga qingshengii]MBC9929403.1 helix-turn-helix domain-containing protein [Chitinophaga qingshengii]
MISLTTLDPSALPEAPRRLMRYVLVYCHSGSLVMTVDHRDFTLQPGDVITITSGQIHHIRENHQAKGYLLEFTLDFFCKDDKDIELIFHNGLFCHFAMNEVIPVGPEVLAAQLALIQEEITGQPYQYLTSVHARITLILVAINRAKVQRGDEIWKPDALFLKFLEAVRDHFEHNYTLKELAGLLGTTEAKLNELARLHAGKTAQHVIYGLVTSEAKRLLTYGDLTVKEVAYKLGFNDPFYFSNFFKKQAQLSPKQYKEQYAI